jgi:hypothetical protein
MIRRIFILEESGESNLICDLTSIDSCYNAGPSDPKLISGLFAAISVFADETLECQNISKDKIDSISTNDSNYYFININHYFYIVEVDSCDNTILISDIKELINHIFVAYLKYNEMSVLQSGENKDIQKLQFMEQIKSEVSKIARKCLFRKN